jgi:hypothetical protein
MTVVNKTEESIVFFRVQFAGGFAGNEMNEEPAQFNE